jgi:thiol:disulfide interchange protein
LNTEDVANLVTRNGVIPITADKTQRRPDIDDLLVELGNPGRGIPFYAVYPGGGGEPITFDGLITRQQVLDALERAGPSVTRPTTSRREDPPPPSQSASLGTGGR